ncbi:MAG: GNAT family N-acetyltransferase [Alphaproteobacteria bacterium]|nr:GNAT family N-acetyltransferase [Alphaproteobacteria bacterium]MBV9370999.1 GNAT family N-acetyltransferase [Alphaproteobacteria bacterium]MBV9899542.1 GNAT family N-acetyltransferase [Alphaproteobacteria bacterium]
MAERIVIPEAPSEAHRLAIVGPLVAFNASHGFPGHVAPVALLVEDEGGAVTGGLWGRTGYGWLFVELLIVPEAMRGRGLGRRLMAEAEAIARERGCVGAWLTTFTFQAQGFYEKLGYALFGALEDSPAGNTRLFMRKRFGEG